VSITIILKKGKVIVLGENAGNEAKDEKGVVHPRKR
jgi:hypothetical protein